MAKGDLKRYREMLKNMSMNDPRRKEIQKKVNDIEKWMISKGIKKGGITKWNDNEKLPNSYPHHTAFVYFDDLHMVAGLNGEEVSYNRDKSVHMCKRCNNDN